MERTQTLALDFTATQHGEAYVASFSGDMNSQVISLTVTPELEEGDILLCSFLKNDLVVDTLVIRNNRMTLPYSVLKSPGEYTAAFAVANLQNRLTAPMLLTVRVAEDRVSLAPTEDYTDQSLICYILTEAASTARAAASEVLEEVEEEIDDLEQDIAQGATALTALSGRVAQAEDDIDDLEEDVAQSAAALSALSGRVTSLEENKPDYAAGTVLLSSATGSTACVNGHGYYTRINDFVIVIFGFYTSGYESLAVSGLPFAPAESFQAAVLPHVNYSDPPQTMTDFKIDFCQTVAGSKSCYVFRSGSNNAVMSSILAYRTNEPLEEETP